MAHVVRAWRSSRMIRLIVLLALLGTATQLVLSRESGLVQEGTRQTKIIGSDRLVSVELLPELAEFCEPVPASREEMLLKPPGPPPPRTVRPRGTLRS